MAAHAVSSEAREKSFMHRYAEQQMDLTIFDHDFAAPTTSMPEDVWLLIAIATDTWCTTFSDRLEAHIELVTNGVHIDRVNGSTRGTHIVTTQREDRHATFLVNLDLIDYDDEQVPLMPCLRTSKGLAKDGRAKKKSRSFR